MYLDNSSHACSLLNEQVTISAIEESIFNEFVRYMCLNTPEVDYISTQCIFWNTYYLLNWLDV